MRLRTRPNHAMQPTAPLRYVFDIRRGDDARFHSQRTCRQTLRRECDLPVWQRLGIERSPSNRDGRALPPFTWTVVKLTSDELAFHTVGETVVLMGAYRVKPHAHLTPMKGV